ncbi:hypothetical protein [Streptomyces scopuliridis]|uniref:hypothetical protein n=1 Tax=Streptomyces scopuliridis TaxID=452529 RepID=UPI0036B838BE
MSAGAAPALIPRQRRALRSVPATGVDSDQGPDQGPADALRLGRGMRLRLLTAVRALLADPSLAGLKDAPRLATVVLFAKSRAPQGCEDDNQTSIWGSELGRWLGMTESTVHHKVLPALRDSGALRTRVVTDAKGHPTGLDCLVMPLWEARRTGGVAHPLALSKSELATLLRLIEALFGHGWAPKGKEPTPPGLLARRKGKGSATDRLGLLLMVLNTRASGWLQLCGGSVRKREGRGAATLARQLGCSPSGARKVLARLTEAGVIAREREATGTGTAAGTRTGTRTAPGRRMNGRGRVMVLPVARAYGRALLTPVEAVQGSEAVFSARPDSAVGDLAPAGDADALGASGTYEGAVASEAGIPERPAGAELHAVHASVVTPVSPLTVSGRFSGEGRGGNRRRPERACGREDQAVDGDDVAAGQAPPGAEVDPLRGEKPKNSPVDERGGKTRQQRGVGRPKEHRLRVALAPVAGLWSRLSHAQQRLVGKAAGRELTVLAGLAGTESAPRLLADRLTYRLEEAGGEGLVRDAVGWLLGRGLVRRRACSDPRCDDGIRLDTGGECQNCGNVLHIRRAKRARIAAEVDAELPGLGELERRQVYEDRLRSQAAVEAEDFIWRRQRAQAEQARRAAARAEAEVRAEREREAAAAADAVRQTLPCEDCGQERAAGLCEACGYRRRTEALIGEVGLIAATWSAAMDSSADIADIAAVTAQVRVTLEADIAAARQQFLELMDPAELAADPVAAASVLAFTALQAVQRAAPEYRRCALAMLGRTEEAEADARRAYATERGRRQHRRYPDGPIAVAAAQKAADAARERTAQHLLAVRLEQLREQAEARTDVATPATAPWAIRLAELAARPISDDLAGAVIT